MYLHSSLKGTSNRLLGLLIEALLPTLYWLTFSLIEIQCWESRILERLEKLTGSARQHLIDLIMSIPA